MNALAATATRANAPDCDDWNDDDDHARFSPAGILQSLRRFATVSEILRIAGAGVVLASMSMYLLQGWTAGNDIHRYLLLLAETGLLATAGLALAYGLKETRGARVFFGLALVSIPANFAILGALLYSLVQWDGALGTYPGFATWRMEDLATTAMTLGASLVVLLPVSLFCFAVLARASSRRLALHFVLLNGLLLLPVRVSLIAGAIAVLGVVYAVRSARGLLARDPALKTAEGRFALTALYLPMAIMLVRSVYFYDLDSLLVALLALAVFAGLRQSAMFPDRSPRVAGFLDIVSLPVAGTAALAFGGATATTLDIGWLAPLVGLVYAALGIDVWRRSGSRFAQRLAAGTASIGLAAGLLVSLMLDPSAWVALLALATGVGLLTLGYRARDPLTIGGGALSLAAAGFFGLDSVIALIVHSSWISLAAIGATTIVTGSVLERHGVAIGHRLRMLCDARAKSRPGMEENP